MILPTFFGIEVIPNHIYKANIQHELLLTRATIDPNAKGEQNARLFVNIEKEEGPVCHLDCHKTTAPLRIRVSPNAQLVLRVAGDCSIHVTGYTSPGSKDRRVTRDMIHETDYYYDEEEEEIIENVDEEINEENANKGEEDDKDGETKRE